jgi:hypothetical protein
MCPDESQPVKVVCDEMIVLDHIGRGLAFCQFALGPFIYERVILAVPFIPRSL